jgi:hypothetical protein
MATTGEQEWASRLEKAYAESTEFAVAGRDIVESLKEASAAGYLAEARLVLADRAALVARADGLAADLGHAVARAEKVTADRDRLAAELAAVRGSGGVLTREECAAMLRRAYHASEVDGAYVDAAVRGARAQRARDVAVVRAVVERLKRERDAVALERAQWTPSERPLSGVDADLDCADAALDAATDCLAALTSDADAEPVAAAAPSGTVRGTIDGAEVTITAGPGVDPAELRDVCLRAVEAWVNGKATPPPLYGGRLPTEDARSDRTRCGAYVIMRVGSKRRLPTCRECKAKMARAKAKRGGR